MSAYRFHLSRPSGVPRGGIRADQLPAAPQPLPAPTGAFPYRYNLQSILSPADYQQILDSGMLVFHMVGDTGGVKEPSFQQNVADHMEGQFIDAPGSKPSFFYILGDVVYYYGEQSNYNSQFYEPYKFYPAPILAIPGNHDGDVDTTNPAVSLAAFNAFFCSPSPVTPPVAGDAPRTTVSQPNVYWTLQTPFADIIGLYTNVPEGGVVKPDQAAWFVGELKNSGQAANRAGKALIVTLHHPPYSLDNHHSGSLAMQQFLSSSFAEAGVQPDLVLSGHVHNYQRFTMNAGGLEIPYIVAGSGGYWNLHQMETTLTGQGSGSGTPVPTPYPNMVLENYCDDHHGFMRITIKLSSRTLTGEYFTVPLPQEPVTAAALLTDSFLLDLAAHRVTTG